MSTAAPQTLPGVLQKEHMSVESYARQLRRPPPCQWMGFDTSKYFDPILRFRFQVLWHSMWIG